MRRSAAEDRSATKSAGASKGHASANRGRYAAGAAHAAKWQEVPQMRQTYAREAEAAPTNAGCDGTFG